MKYRYADSVTIVLLVLIAAGQVSAILPDQLTVDVGDVTGDGQSDYAVLTKRSLRAPGYRVWSYDGAGTYTPVAAPEVRTYRGYVDSDPNLQVNAWVDENNLIDINFNDGRHHTQRQTNLPVDLSGPSGTADPGTGNIEIARSVNRVSPTPSGYVIPKYTMSKMRVGVDICNDVYVAKGSSIDAAVGLCEQRINDSDHFYARDMSLAWEITEVVVRVGGDPASWKTFWKGDDGITPYKFNTKLRFKAPGGGGSAGRVFSAKVDFPNAHSATLGSTSPYSRSLGHEVAHGMGVGHYSDWMDTMSGSNSALGLGTVQKMIEELHLASETSAPAILYGSELAPHAMWDAANTQEGQPVLIDLLENDYDGNGDTIHLAYVDSTSERGGTIKVVSDGIVQYTPPTGYVGVDRFTYHAADSRGLTNRNGRVKVYVRNTGLATHLLLDEQDGATAHDVGPYQAHGTLDSGITPFSTGSQTGIIGNALENLADSVTKARITSDIGDPLSDSLSVSLWVKFNTLPTSDAAIISKGGAVIRGRVDNIRGGWAISVDDGKLYFACKLQTDSQYEGHLADLRDTSNVQTGQWYHLVMTMDRQHKRLRAWINNLEVTNTLAGTVIPDGLIENYYPLTLFNCASDDASLPCVIDDVRIFNNVLSIQEVSDLYATNDDIPAGAPNPPSPSDEVLAGQPISWIPGKPNAYDYRVYLGTDYNSVLNATVDSPEFKGIQNTTTYTPSTQPHTQYFWRIDEVVGSTVVTGDVWRFYTGGTELFGPALANSGFEIQTVDPAMSISGVQSWYDTSYTYTTWAGYSSATFPPAQGSNWAELGNAKWIYQQIGLWTPSTTYDVYALLGAKAGSTFRGAKISLWAGGDVAAASDGVDLAAIGAVQVDSTELLKPSLTAPASTSVRQTLSTGSGHKTGDPLWLRIEQGGGNGRTLVDDVQVTPLLSGKRGYPDFVTLADQWLQTNCGLCNGADLTGDGNVTSADLIEFANRWLSDAF